MGKGTGLGAGTVGRELVTYVRPGRYAPKPIMGLGAF